MAVVVPAFDAARLLPRSLPAALASGADEVLVVDPGSGDGTGVVAVALGARVLNLGRRAGPAEARNAGAGATDADVVLFVDADCVLHADVVPRVRAAFAADPELVALSGSYDDDPPERDLASGYMNLRHHFVHQRAAREGATFWAGLGAVRRAAFERAGGFDAARYPRPMIEDIELGRRLRRLGRTSLDPTLHVTHLKRWTVGSVIATDVARRALPWSKLILETGEMPDDLNLERRQRVAAALAPLGLAGLLVLPVALAAGRPLVALAAAAALVVAARPHVPLLRFFAARRGWAFALPALVLHQVHLTLAGLVFASCAVRHRLQPSWPARGGARGAAS